MLKICTKCKKSRDEEDFKKCSVRHDGLNGCCKYCFSKMPSKMSGTLQYFKSHRWSGIRSRCVNTGTDKKHVTKSYITKGIKLLMTKEDFYSWCDLHSEEIFSMKNPSIDRIENSKGYSIENIRLLERGKNTSLGSIERWNKDVRPVIGVCIKTGSIKKYDHYRHAKSDGFHPSAICHCLSGKRKKHKGYTWRYL